MANILIIDDSSIIRRNLRRILENEGHFIVAEAEDGLQGVEAYKANKIDLVTMDIQMPGLNGIEAVQKIRAFDPLARIVMISSVEQKNMVFEAIKEGAKHYIVKPFEEDKVAEVVRRVLLDMKSARSNTPPAPPAPPRQETVRVSAPVVKSGDSDVGAPYQAAMKDGKIVIRINRQITDKNFSSLLTLVEGLLTIQSLKVVLIFEEIPLLHDRFWPVVVNFIGLVKLNRGLFAIVGEDPAQHALLKSKLNHDILQDYEQVIW